MAPRISPWTFKRCLKTQPHSSAYRLDVGGGEPPRASIAPHERSTPCRSLTTGDEAVGGTDLDAVIVRTEVLDVAEAVSREQHAQLVTLPTTHDELIIAYALIALPDKFVVLRYEQESVFSIERGDTCEGQLPLLR